MYNSIRIIGGKWKGRKIPIMRDVKVRPTVNFMRETLFNWLYAVIPDAICLDCFAGSGALGLEALSRGAREVTFLEHNLVCVNMLLQTIRSLKVLDYSEVIHTDSLVWIRKSKKVYNVVFIDPPFKENLIRKFIFFLEKYNHLQKKSWIYIETSKYYRISNSIFQSYHWFLYRKKITHNVKYYLYLRNL